MQSKVLGKLVEGVVLPQDVKIRHQQKQVTGLAYRACQVEPGDLFLGLGPALVPELTEMECDPSAQMKAQVQGAVGLVLSAGTVLHPQLNLPVFFADHVGQAAAQIAARFYDHPMRKLRVVGITGTNGKTSIAFMLRHILEYAGMTAATLGTLGVQSKPFSIKPGAFTTPPSPDLFRAAAQLVSHQIPTLIMESTSHGLALWREWGTAYDMAVFTNFSPDHLDLHRTMDAYKDAKLSLFRRLSQQPTKAHAPGILNLDDPGFPCFKDATADQPIITFGLQEHAHYRPEGLQYHADGMSFRLIYPGGSIQVRLPMLGQFNLYNALAAFACARQLELDPETIAEGLAAVSGIPGRFQLVPGPACPTIVDFAHTPDSLEKTLVSARALCRGKLWVVFGCGGSRDRSKRPVMGRIAAEQADAVIVTSDNPRHEDPLDIIQAVVDGIPTHLSAGSTSIPDRRAAIHFALERARPEDIVVIAGKGHEKFQIIGDRHEPFDDVKEVLQFVHKTTNSFDPF